MKLSINGQTASLVLNDVAIYERILESTNRRTFGLFRYAEKALRVRNVVMRGDWPASVPTTAEPAVRGPPPSPPSTRESRSSRDISITTFRGMITPSGTFESPPVSDSLNPLRQG